MSSGSRLQTWPLPPELLKRLPLTALAVLICFQFQWVWLRYLTSEAALRFAAWRGFPTERLSWHLIAWNGQRFDFGISCTFADVICGALPLLWCRGVGAARNAVSMSICVAGLLAFNLMRRMGTDVVASAGVPWWLADNVLGGLSYCAVWVFLVTRFQRMSRITAVTASTPSAVVP